MFLSLKNFLCGFSSPPSTCTSMHTYCTSHLHFQSWLLCTQVFLCFNFLLTYLWCTFFCCTFLPCFTVAPLYSSTSYMLLHYFFIPCVWIFKILHVWDVYDGSIGRIYLVSRRRMKAIDASILISNIGHNVYLHLHK